MTRRRRDGLGIAGAFLLVLLLIALGLAFYWALNPSGFDAWLNGHNLSVLYGTVAGRIPAGG